MNPVRGIETEMLGIVLIQKQLSFKLMNPVRGIETRFQGLLLKDVQGLSN